MNLDLWKSMTIAQQETVLQAVRESTVFERERSTHYEGIILDNMREYGTIITELTPAQKLVWKNRILDSGVYSIIKNQMVHPEYLDDLVK
jgi:TRAP-type C4-dicarboxylate transport system substrate-binding protein